MRFRHLRTRLAVLYAGLFAVTLFALAVAVQVVVSRNAAQAVRAELVATGTVFDRLWALRSDQLGDGAAVLARDFGFREAVATGDAATTRSALDNLKARLGLHTAFIVDLDGGVVGLDGAAAQADAAALWEPLDAGRTAGIISLDGQLLQAVAVPVRAPMPAGWVVFGADLGPAEMRGLEQLAAIPLSATVTSVAARGVSADAPVEVDGAMVLSKRLPRLESGAPALLTLRYPLALALAPYRPLQVAVAVAAIIGLLLLLIGSFRLAQGITRPVAALDGAARKLERGEFDPVDVTTSDEIGRLAGTFNRMIAGIAERERRITHLAFNDALTDLPNRALLREQLDFQLRQTAGRERGPAVLCVGLDNFKAINETLGHSVGDQLLCVVADRLRGVAEGAFVARLGGNEFAFIVSAELGGEAAEGLARRIIAAIDAPIVVGGQPMAVGVSVGIAVGPADGADAESLLKNAALAAHGAKGEGRGTYRFFENAMNLRAQARRAIEMDLREALANDELRLFYQPLYGLATDEICGFEALMRWQHPLRGLVPPAEFVEVAEETGLIVAMGEWAIGEACRQASQWPAHVRVAVNVSPIQFRSPTLGHAIQRALLTSGIAPDRLEIEITESVFLGGADATLALLRRLRKHGIRIALDDFGTGYSSLGYLRSFPFDKIKIDRSFIVDVATDENAAAIVRAMTGMAAALHMETTAEGVEQEAQVAVLRGLGCSSVQGYLFSRPVPAAQVAGLLAVREPALPRVVA